jgi:hypothetical protein
MDHLSRDAGAGSFRAPAGRPSSRGRQSAAILAPRIIRRCLAKNCDKGNPRPSHHEKDGHAGRYPLSEQEVPFGDRSTSAAPNRRDCFDGSTASYRTTPGSSSKEAPFPVSAMSSVRSNRGTLHRDRCKPLCLISETSYEKTCKRVMVRSADL